MGRIIRKNKTQNDIVRKLSANKEFYRNNSEIVKIDNIKINFDNEIERNTNKNIVINEEFAKKTKLDTEKSTNELENNIPTISNNTIAFIKKMKEEEEFSDKEAYFDISYFLLLKNACCKRCLSDQNIQKIGQLEYAKNYIHKKLDIAFYIKLFLKFDYLIKIILSKEERLLFTFSKKPPLKDKKSDKVDNLINKDKKQKLVKFIESIKQNKLLNNRKVSIMKLLNPNVKEYLKNSL